MWRCKAEHTPKCTCQDSGETLMKRSDFKAIIHLSRVCTHKYLHNGGKSLLKEELGVYLGWVLCQTGTAWRAK